MENENKGDGVHLRPCGVRQRELMKRDEKEDRGKQKKRDF